MTKISPLLACFALVLASCLPQSKKEETTTEWKTFRSANFSLKVPASLKETTNLHEDAVAQFQNPIKEFYCIVMAESATTFQQAVEDAGIENDYPLNLDGYANLIGDRFAENVDEVIKKTELIPVTVNGRDGRYFEANAKVSGIEIHYHYGFVKGDTTYYQVMSWTTLNKETKFNDTMFEILRSFKEK